MSGGTFDSRVAKIVNELYPWSRQNVIEAEVAGKRSLRQVWIQSIRNGLDDFIMALKLKGEGRTDEALERLGEAESHFRTGAREAWIQTATTKAARLHQLIRSVGTLGNESKARKHWEEAQALLVKARTMYPEHDERSVPIAKEAAFAAIAGVELLAPKEARKHTFGLWGIAGASLGALTGALLTGSLGAVVGALFGSTLGYLATNGRSRRVEGDD